MSRNYLRIVYVVHEIKEFEDSFLNRNDVGVNAASSAMSRVGSKVPHYILYS